MARYSSKNTKRVRTTSVSHEEILQKRLKKVLTLLVGIPIVLILLFTFFAPAIGTFFGLLSKNRNKDDNVAVIKPNPPVFASIPNATKEEKINVTGYAQPGMTVVLFVNGPEKGRTTVGSDGVFTFDNVDLNNGKNIIFAKSIDSSNNESDPSSTYTLQVDKQKPKLEITSPEDGKEVRNLDGRIKISGKISEKGTVKINGKQAVVRPDLTFDFLLGVDQGDVKITIEATDEAGNSEIEVLNVKYKKSS